ncbi:MAG TPA: glycosyltransferase family 4 protein [Gemmataceae bacterium]|nr:glycosyltransferase family 4 protein [Gemmataceae bacterium]
MKFRTLLLVTCHFPPSAASGSFRLLGFARHLPACGWRTVVVAPPNMPFEPVDDKLCAKIPRETVVYSAPYPRGNRVTRRFASFAAWMPTALKACARAIAAERPDAVLTSSPPHAIHLLGRLLKARYGLPWIVDYRDPWVNGLGEACPRTWHARWESLKEKLVLGAADGIIVNTPLARAALRDDLPQFAAKMTAITNGFDPEDFIRNEPIVVRPSTLSVLHTGELYCGRDPRPLFEALQGLRLPSSMKRLQVAFLGQSSDPSHDWPEEIRERGLENMVSFAGHVPYSQALTRMQAADILLLLDNPGRRVGIPAKLFEYFGARRPILALAEPHGDVAWALRVSGVRHRIAPPTDAIQIRHGLTELIADVTSLGTRTCESLTEGFTRAHMATQLARFLDQKTARSHACVG